LPVLEKPNAKTIRTPLPPVLPPDKEEPPDSPPAPFPHARF
jgi:hypothetical protein